MLEARSEPLNLVLIAFSAFFAVYIVYQGALELRDRDLEGNLHVSQHAHQHT